jgi:nitrogen regulatory protein PII
VFSVSEGKEQSKMKRIDAVIRPSQLEEVKQRVTALGVTGLTVSEVRGFGRQKGHTETYRGSEYTVDFLPKIFVSIAVAEELVEPVVEAIIEGARTGVIGDGKIFVSSLDEVIRIRTGERGPGAI